MINFKLLTEEDVMGENKLSIFNKIPATASLTDFAKFNIRYASDDRVEIIKPVSYYLDSFHYERIKKPTKDYRIGTFDVYHNMYIKTFNGSIIKSLKLPDCYLENNYGVRLKVDYDEAKEHIISDIYGNGQGYSDTPYKPSENGVIELLAFEYPKNYISDDDPKKGEIELLYEYDKLEPSKEFIIRTSRYSVEKYQSYEYKGKKYIRVDGEWISIEPIVWYYDEEQNVLVSKDIIMGGICVTNEKFYSMKKMENFRFEDTYLFDNLKSFSEQCLMDEYSVKMYYFPFRSFKIYEGELKEINKWENYYDDRQLRKNYLQEIKEYCLNSNFDNAKDMNSLIEKIERIEKINQEDESLIIQKYPMLAKTCKVKRNRKKV